MPVAVALAQARGAPLDVYLVRKLGVPGHAELALGAIASGGVRFVNQGMLRSLRIFTPAARRGDPGRGG